MCMGFKSLGKSSIAGPGTRYLYKKMDKEMEGDRVKPQEVYTPEPLSSSSKLSQKHEQALARGSVGAAWKEVSGKAPKKNKPNTTSSLQINK